MIGRLLLILRIPKQVYAMSNYIQEKKKRYDALRPLWPSYFWLLTPTQMEKYSKTEDSNDLAEVPVIKTEPTSVKCNCKDVQTG